MGRYLAFLYGVVCYVTFLGTFLYAIGFVGNVLVPKSIDSGMEGQLTGSLVINALLLGLFAVQHSVMARLGFKKMWTRIIPEPVERSTYVLLSNAALVLMYCQWRPLTGTVWSIENPNGILTLQILFWAGWLIVLGSSFMINHFDLFGLRQVVLHLQKKAYTAPEFKIPGIYKYVRHPLMVGFIIAFWATPVMTVGHLFFSVLTTLYILVAIHIEERDLVHYYGEKYEEYRKRTNMIIPFMQKK